MEKWSNFPEHYEQLNDKVSRLEKDNMKSRQIIFRNTKLKDTSNTDKSDNLAAQESSAVKQVASKKSHGQYGPKMIKNMLSHSEMDRKFMHALVHDTIKCGFVKDHREWTCTSRKFLKDMCLASGSLNLGDIEILRQAEGLEHRETGSMTSKGQTKNVQNILSKHEDRILSFVDKKTETGEFDVKHILSVVMGVHELSDIWKERSIEFTVASDGANINNDLHQVIIGFKVADTCAIDPSTNRIIKP